MNQDQTTQSTEPDFKEKLKEINTPEDLYQLDPEKYVRFEHSGKPFHEWKALHLKDPNKEAQTTYPNLVAFVGSELNKNNRNKGSYFVQH